MMTSIYILESILPVEDSNNTSENVKYKTDENGAISVFRQRIGCFSSVEKAEETIGKLLDEHNKQREAYSMTAYAGFMLFETYLDNPLFDSDYVSEFESIRSYDRNGELLYFSDVDERGHKSFFGGDNPSKVAKSGDYAFILQGSIMIPCLVDAIPYTKEEWKSHFNDNVFGDFTDDSGLVYIPDYGHSHPLWAHVFPLSSFEHECMSDEVKKACIKAKEELF